MYFEETEAGGGAWPLALFVPGFLLADYNLGRMCRVAGFADAVHDRLLGTDHDEESKAGCVAFLVSRIFLL